MIILDKKQFRLPHLEKETFVSLMRLGLEYDRVAGVFRVSNCNNIEKLLDVLKEILHDSCVSFMQRCLVCRRDFPCQECRYFELCETRGMPFSCVCGKCLETGKAAHEKEY